MPIDPNQIQWDQSTPSIDPSKISWDAPSQNRTPRIPEDRLSLQRLRISPFGDTSDQAAQERMEAIGSGLTNVYQGIKQRLGYATPEEVAEKRQMDASIAARPGLQGAWGQKLGEALPFLAIPQAGIASGLGTGALIGATAPTTSDESVLGNTIKGTIAGSIPGVIGAGVQGAKSLISPLTISGRENAVAKALLNQANNPEKALSNIAQAPEYVSGSTPTTGTASGDPGLISAERTARSMFPEKFSETNIQNNSARWNALDKLAPNDKAITDAINARNQQILPKLQEAIDEAGGRVDTSSILDSINQKLKGPEGVQDAPSKFLSFAKDKLENKVGDSFENLYALRKDVDDAMAGRLGNDDIKGIKFAKKTAVDIKSQIDNALNAASSGKFGDYLDKFKELSKPINEMQSGSDIANNFITAQPDTLGNPTISPAIYRRALSKNLESDYGPNFSPEKEQILKGIESDLNRQGTLDTAKSLGSDTFQNLTKGGKLEDLTRSAASKIPFVGSVIKSQSEKTLGLLADALKDPDLASRLMNKGLAPEQSSALVNVLRRLSVVPSTVVTYK